MELRTMSMPTMSAVPRWSHRDPVEAGNPFPAGDLRHTRWEEATVRARAKLQRYDDEIAASVSETLTSGSYARRWLDLATMRFDTWARRGLTAVDGTAAQRDYAAWLQTYVTNWRAYIADTCPHVAPDVRAELALRLTARAAHWINEATRQRPADTPLPDVPRTIR
jgi:hypothetical protein